jgi:hypothetical protein
VPKTKTPFSFPDGLARGINRLRAGNENADFVLRFRRALSNATCPFTPKSHRSSMLVVAHALACRGGIHAAMPSSEMNLAAAR